MTVKKEKTIKRKRRITMFVYVVVCMIASIAFNASLIRKENSAK